MKRILLCNGKGGTGKTTATVLLALAAEENGLKVAIHDIDPQRSSYSWIQNNETTVEICEESKNYDLVFVDTPPRLESKELHSEMKISDANIVITTLSPNDILTTERTIDTIQKLGLAKKSHLLINMFDKRTVLSKQEGIILEHFEGIKRLKHRISQRQAYQYAMLEGWKALSGKDKKEISGLILEIASL